MNSLLRVKQDFLKITRISPRYDTNTVAERMARGNYLLDALSEKVFDHPSLLGLLSKKIRHWLKWDDSEFTLALAGYIAYLGEQYREAETFFLKALKKNRRNIDLWVDLAFSLYHQDEKKQKLAHDILFRHEQLSEKLPENRISLPEIQSWLLEPTPDPMPQHPQKRHPLQKRKT